MNSVLRLYRRQHGTQSLEDRETQEVESARQAPGGAYAELNALVIEDSMIIAMDTEDCLLELGVGNVRIESTVAGALDAVTTWAPNLVLLDYNLGKETGDAVAEELARRGIPFWLATGDIELKGRCTELGARGLLIKPFGMRELAAMLAELSPV